MFWSILVSIGMVSIHSQSVRWHKYRVEILGFEKKKGIENRLIFKTKAGKLARSDRVGSELLDWGAVAMAGVPVYYIIYKDIGTDIQLRIYFQQADKIEFQQKEFSKYLTLEMKDINGDKNYEVQTVETRFIAPKLQQGKFQCHLPPVPLNRPLPAFYSLVGQKIREVTFARQYLRYYYRDLQNIERLLVSNRRQRWRLDSADDRGKFRQVVSYVYYMMRIGKVKRAGHILRKSKIRLYAPCISRKRDLSLYKFIYVFRKSIIRQKNDGK